MVSTPEAGVEEQSSAADHEGHREHEHRAKRPTRRSVCLPAADAVPPVAVFAKDVHGEQDRGEERKGSERHRAA